LPKKPHSSPEVVVMGKYKLPFKLVFSDQKPEAFEKFGWSSIKIVVSFLRQVIQKKEERTWLQLAK
jgi:hypothetical protein